MDAEEGGPGPVPGSDEGGGPMKPLRLYYRPSGLSGAGGAGLRPSGGERAVPHHRAHRRGQDLPSGRHVLCPVLQGHRGQAELLRHAVHERRPGRAHGWWSSTSLCRGRCTGSGGASTCTSTGTPSSPSPGTATSATIWRTGVCPGGERQRERRPPPGRGAFAPELRAVLPGDCAAPGGVFAAAAGQLPGEGGHSADVVLRRGVEGREGAVSRSGPSPWRRRLRSSRPCGSPCCARRARTPRRPWPRR